MNEKTRDTILTIICYLLSLLPFVWWGREMAEIETLLYGELDTGQSMLFYGGSLLVLLIWFSIHTIFHEFGHLIAGLLTGYRFVSFRVGKLVLVKENGKLTTKKMTLKGTSGQCLMCPPPSKPEEMEDTWYLLGGPLANMVLASLSMYLYSIFTYTLATYIVFFLGGISGLICCIMNLFPMKAGGMVNDGYNIFITGRNAHAKAALYYCLTANAQMSEKEQLSDISEELLSGIKEFSYEDITNVGEGNLFSLCSLIYLAEGEYEAAEACSRRLFETEGVLGLFKYEAQCDLLYHELIGACRQEEIKKLYTKELKKYINQTSSYPARKMLMFAYYHCCKKDEMQATRELCDLKALKDVYPVRFDYGTALKEVERLKAAGHPDIGKLDL
ncbi:MAG: M50 family metallopeptidase [Lachnospiraceae bacterium]|nr:M50 family metallopeptidase [Lachnospiraceae bacterium]